MLLLLQISPVNFTVDFTSPGTSRRAISSTAYHKALAYNCSSCNIPRFWTFELASQVKNPLAYHSSSSPKGIGRTHVTDDRLDNTTWGVSRPDFDSDTIRLSASTDLSIFESNILGS